MVKGNCVKKQLALKYPYSANLFRFCKRVLDKRLGGARVIDQDIGHILGFDPADCSHWKKGKKHVHSITAMKSIAQHLDLDEKLVIDIASGTIDDEEAFHEFLGYGDMHIDSKTVDQAKKDFFKAHSSKWTREKEQEFRKALIVNEERVIQTVKTIHENIRFLEAPLYLPELISYYPDIVLEDMSESSSEELLGARKEKNKWVIRYKSGTDQSPFVRYQIAKSLADYFLPAPQFNPDIKQYQSQVFEIERNIFSSHLLAPDELIRKEIAKANVAKDLLSQLAEAFWVSKFFMNLRLKDMLR